MCVYIYNIINYIYMSINNITSAGAVDRDFGSNLDQIGCQLGSTWLPLGCPNHAAPIRLPSKSPPQGGGVGKVLLLGPYCWLPLGAPNITD